LGICLEMPKNWVEFSLDLFDIALDCARSALHARCMKYLRFSNLVLSLATGLVFLSGAAVAGDQRSALFMHASEIKWVDTPGANGAQMAVLWGDPETGAYGAFRKRPGGDFVALHTHTHDGRVIILSGVLLITMEGDAQTELGPGSYALIPSGAKHTSGCKAGSDCVYFEEQPGASDINFIKTAATK
jgi:quercetin dioxygenase-like cupin family protein